MMTMMTKNVVALKDVPVPGPDWYLKLTYAMSFLNQTQCERALENANELSGFVV